MSNDQPQGNPNGQNGVPPQYGQQPQQPPVYQQPEQPAYGQQQPTYGQTGYGQPVQPQYYAQPPQQPGYPVAAKTNTMAILSLIFAFVFSVLGIVFGHIALSQIKRTGEGGRGLAMAGLIIGYIFTAIAVLYIIFIIVLVAAFGSYSYSYTTY